MSFLTKYYRRVRGLNPNKPLFIFHNISLLFILYSSSWGQSMFVSHILETCWTSNLFRMMLEFVIQIFKWCLNTSAHFYNIIQFHSVCSSENLGTSPMIDLSIKIVANEITSRMASLSKGLWPLVRLEADINYIVVTWEVKSS